MPNLAGANWLLFAAALIVCLAVAFAVFNLARSRARKPPVGTSVPDADHVPTNPMDGPA